MEAKDPLQTAELTDDSALAKSTPADPGVRGDSASVDLLTLQYVLGISLPDGPQRTQLQVVQEHLNNRATGASTAEIRAALYKMERLTGEPKLGETRLSRLYNYIKLSQQINDLEAAKLEYSR